MSVCLRFSYLRRCSYKGTQVGYAALLCVARFWQFVHALIVGVDVLPAQRRAPIRLFPMWCCGVVDDICGGASHFLIAPPSILMFPTQVNVCVGQSDLFDSLNVCITTATSPTAFGVSCFATVVSWPVSSMCPCHLRDPFVFLLFSFCFPNPLSPR